MWVVHLFFGLRSPLLWLSGGSQRAVRRSLPEWICRVCPKSTLKRYDEEVALIRRFARNHDINFRVFSKRYRRTSGSHEAWAAKFLGRFDTARAAVAAHSDDNSD
jgi:hypothetical protein